MRRGKRISSTRRRWWRRPYYYVPVTIARRLPGKPNGPSERLRTRRRDRKTSTPYVSGYGPSRAQGVPATRGRHGESGLRASEGNRFEKQNSTHRERRLFADTGKSNTRTRSTSGQSQANKTPTTGNGRAADDWYVRRRRRITGTPWKKRRFVRGRNETLAPAALFEFSYYLYELYNSIYYSSYSALVLPPRRVHVQVRKKKENPKNRRYFYPAMETFGGESLVPKIIRSTEGNPLFSKLFYSLFTRPATGAELKFRGSESHFSIFFFCG